MCVCRCVCGCACMHTHVCAQVVVVPVRTCAHVRVRGCIPAYVCVCPCRGCAHPEKPQGSWNSGVSSPGLCPWGARSHRLLQPPAEAAASPRAGGRSGAWLAPLPDISLAPAGCALSGAAAAPVSPGWSTPRAWGTQGWVWGCSSRLLLHGPMEQGHNALGSTDYSQPPVTYVGPVA